MSDEATQPEESETPETIRFNHIKSNHYRVIHVDGVTGGLTPSLDIFFSCWNERAAIPQQTVHRIKEEGGLGDEILEERVTRGGIVREVEVGLVMRVGSAKLLIEWLQSKVDKIESLQNDSEDVDAT